MKTDINLWTTTFIVSFSFFTAAFIIFWVSLRRFLRRRNFRPLCLGLGFIIIAGTNLLTFLFSQNQITWWLMFFYLVGFELILLSLIIKKKQYPLLLLGIFPFFILNSSIWFPFSLIFLLPIPYLAFFNFCKASSACDFCSSSENKSSERREWSLIFFMIILSIFFFVLSRSQFSDAKEIFYIASIASKSIAVILVYYHILKCITFSKGERVLLPLMTSFIIILTLISYMTISLVSSYMEKFIISSSGEEVNAVKEIILLSYPETFIEKVKVKDEKLNDLLDNIYAKTGIRSAIFLGNERVAATFSATGKGRMVGTRIEDANVNKDVLENGYDYTGKVEKGEEFVIAAYTPIFEEDKVIGMIGTGKTLTLLYELHYKILSKTVAGVAVVMLLVFSVTYYTVPKRM